MAVTAQQALSLTAGLFKAVPSKLILTDMVKFNGNIEQFAATLGASEFAINAFPFSNAEKAKLLAENLLGSTVTADAKAAAVTALEGILNANGGNVGSAAQLAITVINSDAAYADAKAQLENRVKVAAAYVDSARGTEISNSILNEVTKDAATVTAAIEKLNSNNTPAGNYAGTPNDDTVSLLGGLASTIKIEGGQQGAAGDTLVITAQASATANVINLQNFADQNRTLDTEQRKVSPIIQGFENVDATGSTTEMNITGRDRTSELNTGSVASTQTGSVLKGGAYRDTVTGAAGADSIEGNAGNDVLDGGAGNDTIKGGADNDSITGGTGNDTIEDGTGNDTVSGGADNDTITIGGGVDLINGDDGNDTISFAKDAAAGTSATVRTTVNGGAGNDAIDNTNATATSFLQVSGGANNDKITLGVATENINAGANNDIIVIKQAALDQVGTVAAGDLDVLNGNDGQDALQLLLTSGDATTTFRLTPVTGQYSGFEVIELIDESGNTNAKTYKIDLTDDFVANNFVNGQFLIDARGLPAGSNLVIDTSALTAASAARFTAGAFQVWTSPSTDIRDQLNKTIDANYAINASNAALNATRAFYTNSSDTTNKAGVHDATTGLITTTPSGATAYTVVGGNVEGATGGSAAGNAFMLNAAASNLTTTTNTGTDRAGTTVYLDNQANAITGSVNVGNATIITDTTAGDGDSLSFTLSAAGPVAPAVAGIETINVTSLLASGLNAALITGATKLTNAGTNVLTVTNLQQATNSLGLNGNLGAGLNVTYAGADTNNFAGTLTLDGGTLVGGTLTVAGNDIDQLTIVSSGTTANAVTISDSFAEANGGTAETITVTGTTALTIAGTAANLGTANSSTITATNTGGTTVRYTDTGAITLSVAGYTGVSTYEFSQTGAGAVAITGLNGGSSTFNLRGADMGVITASATNAGHVLNVVDADATAGDAFGITLGNANISTVNLTAAAGQTGTVTLTNFNQVGTQTFNLFGPASGTAGNFQVTLANQANGTLAFNGGTYAGNLTIATTAANAAVNVTGGAGNDTITGTNNADVLNGGAGNDTINSGAGGNKVITGGLGADTINLQHTAATDITTTLNVTAAQSFATAGQFDTVVFSDNGNANTNTVTLNTGVTGTALTGATSVTIGTTAVTAGAFLAVGSVSATLTTTNQNFQIYQDSNMNGIIDATDLRVDFNDGSVTDTMAITLVGGALVVTTTGVA